MDGIQKLTNSLSNGTIPDPLRPPLPRNWGFATQLPPLISGTGKATDLKFGGYIYRANPTKSPLIILEKRERGRIKRVPKFFGYLVLSQERVKLRSSNFVRTFIASIGTKAHEKCWEQQRCMGVVRESRKFQGIHVQVAWGHCAVIFAIAQLSCFTLITINTGE